MTKQEMAEWLAEKMLGGTQSGGIWILMLPHFKNQEGMRISNEYLAKIIYSPDGFFAVIGEINKRLAGEGVRSIELDLAWYTFFREMDYEAFYNAVYEAMK